MKYLIILGDGMSDEPIARLGGKTPLMAAKKPHIDQLAAMGRNGLFKTVPDSMKPGSEVANLAVLGYDGKLALNGRGVLEAASMGVELADTDLAIRCNIINITDEKIKNHSAGHITTEEADILIKDLDKALGNETIKFYTGVSYRHLLVIKNGNKHIKCTPPHDVPGTPFKDVMIQATAPEGEETAKMLNTLIMRSQEILKNHPVNSKRIEKGKDAANSIWPWSQGHKPQMKTYQELYGLTGATVAAVDLIQGIGKFAGLDAIKVDGVTGLHDTNYEGKAEAAINALKEKDFVYLHIEASDEAGHEGDVDLKIKTIEYLDQRVVKYIIEETQKMSEPVAIAILPDHPTPCEKRTHTNDPVPFLIYYPGIIPDTIQVYDETNAAQGNYGLIRDDEFIKTFLSSK